MDKSRKSLLSKLINRLPPGMTKDLRALYVRQVFMRRYKSIQDASAKRIFPKNQEIQILSGPFAGMRYLNETVWGPLMPKWAGTYEMEIQPWICDIVRTPPGIVIDVGCAEGYYAVGLARSIPALKVYAFDVDATSRNQVRKLAELNGCQDRVVLDKWCSHEKIDSLLSGRTGLLIVDVEGYEVALLDPAACASLRQAQLIVELHSTDQRSIDATQQILVERFSDTHSVEEIQSKARSGAECHEMLERGFNNLEIQELLNEHRGYGQRWLNLIPKLSIPQ